MRTDWNMLALVTGAGVGACIAFFLLRRFFQWLLGPIFFWEVERFARKGHTSLLRVIFALLVLGLLFAVTPKSKEYELFTEYDLMISVLPPSQHIEYIPGHFFNPLSEFATEFSDVFLVALAAGLMLMTPLYFGITLTEEKEKRSIDFLLTTHLKSREIVLGKFAARLLNLFGMLLAGLPIIALTQFWGGVLWQHVIRGFFVIAAAVVTFGAIGMACSVVFATRSAVFAAYVISLLINGTILGSPVWQIMYSEDMPRFFFRPLISGGVTLNLVDRQAIYLAICGVLTILSLAVAVRRLRFFAARHAGGHRRVLGCHSDESKEFGSVPNPLTIAANPKIGGDPLIWKERYVGRTWGGWLLNTAVWYYFDVGLIILTVFATAAHDALGHAIANVMRFVTVAIGALILVGVGLRMASSISREREQQTLINLLTLPVKSRRILAAKWIGTLLRSQRALIGLACCFVVFGLAAKLSIFAWLLIPICFLAHLWFFGNLGLLLSMFCNSTNRAYSLLLGIMLIVAAEAWVISYFNPPLEELMMHFRNNNAPEEYYALPIESSYSGSVQEWFSPPQTWLRLMMAARLNVSSIWAALAYFVVGCLLWVTSLLRFRRERAWA